MTNRQSQSQIHQNPPANTLLRYEHTRRHSLGLCVGLSPEDMQVQSMAEASPIKWHLAHTTWFFETFILKPYAEGYVDFDQDFRELFNSYYNGVGRQFERGKRGILTRPSIDEVCAYREHVDKSIRKLDAALDLAQDFELSFLLELGIQHEQQHQELMLTDIKHAFFQNPKFPAVLPSSEMEYVSDTGRLEWLDFEGGIFEIGYQGDGFHFDNEGPPHRIYLQPFRLASRLTSNGEYLAFVESGAYHDPIHWLSEGWEHLRGCDRRAPLYWHKIDRQWYHFTMNGLCPINPETPVMHVDYYEADAFARWAGKRLPTEQEWEVASLRQVPAAMEKLSATPLHATQESALKQMFNTLWQWTSSSYTPYPGYHPLTGTVGEYNGKFMVNQYVLRGGSLATPPGHIRESYRNFFYPDAGWQFSGIRLADSTS